MLGAIIFSGISVYATATILSKNVAFTPTDSNWKVTNTEEALNDLYEYANSSIFDKLSLESKKNISSGPRMISRSTSLTLDAGNYLIVGINTYSTNNSNSNATSSNKYTNINYSSGNCTKINDNVLLALGSQSVKIYGGSNLYFGFYSDDNIWKCSFDKNTTVSLSGAYSDDDTSGHGIRIYSVKLD